MYIEIHDEVKKEVRLMIEDALQYGEHGDFRKLITDAKDIKELKVILHNIVDSLLSI
jgi:hypothetical protein